MQPFGKDNAVSGKDSGGNQLCRRMYDPVFSAGIIMYLLFVWHRRLSGSFSIYVRAKFSPCDLRAGDPDHLWKYGHHRDHYKYLYHGVIRTAAKQCRHISHFIRIADPVHDCYCSEAVQGAGSDMELASLVFC